MQIQTVWLPLLMHELILPLESLKSFQESSEMSNISPNKSYPISDTAGSPGTVLSHPKPIPPSWTL